MDVAAAMQLIGGLGMFLLGILHLTDGIKGLAGDSLRRALELLVSGRWSGLATGVVFTALIQSSSAATLTVIGFVSAGLVTFPQAVSVVLGANLGTTATAWLVAIFGFKIKISTAALPMLGLGAFLWLLAKGRVRSSGAVLAGFGLVFVGIEFLQSGMAAVSWDFSGLAGGDARSLWILAAIGAAMTVVMQSSSAAGATTLVALHAGSIDFQQGCAMIVGQNIGTTVTALMAVPGGGLAVRRTALAHVIFNVVTGVLTMLVLGPMADFSSWLGAGMGDADGVLALAVFNTVSKVAGLALFFPWLDHFSHGIERISGRGTRRPSERLNPTLAAAGGGVALKVGWQVTAELSRTALAAARSGMAGGARPGELGAVAGSDLEALRGYLEKLRIDPGEPETFHSRVLRMWHSLDHLSRLNDTLRSVPERPGEWRTPAELDEAIAALDAWLARMDEGRGSSASLVERMEQASRALAERRRKGRSDLLARVAAGELPAGPAQARLELLMWADTAFYHAWRLADSLRQASARGDQEPEEDGAEEPETASPSAAAEP